MALLSWEDGLVKIDGQQVPGILVDQSVDCAVKFDEQEVDGMSGKKRTPMGWEDIEVSLSLLLLTEDDGTDCYDKLQTINGIFRSHDGQANPKLFDVDNRHLQARGVGQLIFSGLNSMETDRDDSIRARLSFVENNPPVVKTETNVAKSAFKKVKDKKKEKEAQKKVTVPGVDPTSSAGGKRPGVIIDAN